MRPIVLSVGEYAVAVADHVVLHVGPPALTGMTCSIVPSMPASAAGAVEKARANARVAARSTRSASPRGWRVDRQGIHPLVMSAHHRRARDIVVCAVLTVALLSPSPAPAATVDSSLAIRPAEPGQVWLVIRARPGQIVRRDAIVANSTRKGESARLYTVDARASAGGAFVLDPETAVRDDVGAWTTLSAASVVVPPAGERRVTISVHVPPDAPTGRHAGGVVLQGAGRVTRAPKTGERILVVTRLGLRVYVTVIGKTPVESSSSDTGWAIGLAALALIGLALAAWRWRRTR